MQTDVQFKTVEQYLSSFPAKTKAMLKDLRKTIKQNAPKAEELISYNMPAYKLNGPLVYFAGYKNHIGLYPTPNGIAAFKKELSRYKSAKGSVQFPIDEALPLGLIAEIVKFKVAENLEKESSKTKKK